MYTPAVTMVAAWISALTGVGPSMASGSHTWSGICALFPRGAHEQEEAHGGGDAELAQRLPGQRGGVLRQVHEVDGPERVEGHDHAQDQAHVADPVHDEGLHARARDALGFRYQNPISR